MGTYHFQPETWARRDRKRWHQARFTAKRVAGKRSLLGKPIRLTIRPSWELASATAFAGAATYRKQPLTTSKKGPRLIEIGPHRPVDWRSSDPKPNVILEAKPLTADQAVKIPIVAISHNIAGDGLDLHSRQEIASIASLEPLPSTVAAVPTVFSIGPGIVSGARRSTRRNRRLMDGPKRCNAAATSDAPSRQ